MFVVLHLFYLVLDPGQVPDCKEFWLEGWVGGGVGVIGCRFWSSESNTRSFMDFCRTVHVLKLFLCLEMTTELLPSAENKIFQEIRENRYKVTVKAQLLVLFRHNAPTGQHNAYMWFTEDISAMYHIKKFWKHMSLVDHCSLLNRSFFFWWKPSLVAFEESHRCRNGSAKWKVLHLWCWCWFQDPQPVLWSTWSQTMYESLERPVRTELVRKHSLFL